MLSRFVVARPSPLRLLATLRTQVCSRSLSSLRRVHSAPSYTNLRRFSASPIPRIENRAEPPTPRAPSGTCYVANIPYNVTAEQLKDALSEFGKVESVTLLTSNGGLSRGVGFVQFGSVAEAVSFIEANEADPIFVLDRQLHVEHAHKTRSVSKPVEPSDTLVLFNFQGESDMEVRTMFGNHAENILAVRFDKKESDLASRKAFIQFRNVNIATEAMDAFKNQNGNTRIILSGHQAN